MTTSWLPHPPLTERREEFAAIRAATRGRERLHLSDFVLPESILFFDEPTERTILIDALLKTLRGIDLPMARRAVWQRNGDLPLRVSSEVLIYRGRVGALHHLQAAVAIVPSSETPIHILFVGPVDQNRMHAGMLVAISSIFSRAGLARRLLKLRKPQAVIDALRHAENPEPWTPSWPRALRLVWDFFRLRYIGIAPETFLQ